MLPNPSSNPKAVLESSAIRFLSSRPRFKAEVINHLAQKAKQIGLVDPLTLIDQIIESLEKPGFLNDDQFLESYIKNRLIGKKKGPLWIKQHLLRLDLSRNTIDAALAKFAPKQTQISVLRDYLQKQSKPIDPKIKAKLYRRLLGRGFSSSIITLAFDGSTFEEV